MAQCTASVGEANTTSSASPTDLTRRPPKARITGTGSASCRHGMRAFSSRVWALVRAVNPAMPVNITARFWVFMARGSSRGNRYRRNSGPSVKEKVVLPYPPSDPASSKRSKPRSKAGDRPTATPPPKRTAAPKALPR